MRSIKSALQIIKQAYISFVTDDSHTYPRGQATYNGKTTNYLRLSPYGLNSNPPDGAWVLLLSSQGHESTKIGIAADFINRKKNLLAGEIALFNTLTGSFVLLKANGDVEVDSANDLTANVAGNLTATVSGVATVTATTNITLTAPIISLIGTIGVGAGVPIPATGLDVGANAITSKEIAVPATPGTLQAASYFKDNGSGKTQFAIKWKSGAESIIATEP